MIYGKKIWGPILWNLLHSFSISNNSKIKNNKKYQYYILYTSIIYIIPCQICSDHYKDIVYEIYPLDKNKITRFYLKKWVFNVHNIINSLIGNELYYYHKFKKNNITIDNKKIYFIIKLIYINFDYINMSYYKYDNIYNFFIYFCKLYPDNLIKIKLKILIKTNEFKNINTPLEFKKWFDININNNIKNILYEEDNNII